MKMRVHFEMDLVNNPEMWLEIVLLRQLVYKPVPLLIIPEQEQEQGQEVDPPAEVEQERAQAVARPAAMEQVRGRLTLAGQ